MCEVCACVLGVGTGRQRLSPRQSISCRINIISPRVGGGGKGGLGKENGLGKPGKMGCFRWMAHSWGHGKS